MNIGMRIAGINELKFRLRNIAERVPERGRKVMHSSANRIVKEAALNAPVDDHQLEKSIHKEIAYEERGRLTITVEASGVIDGVDVTVYALEMHENYESYTPGEGTVAKRAANPGRYVGGKFLERALEEERDRLSTAMIVAVREELTK